MERGEESTRLCVHVCACGVHYVFDICAFYVHVYVWCSCDVCTRNVDVNLAAARLRDALFYTPREREKMYYVVHVLIATSSVEPWWEWMREIHIPEVIDTGCFVEARAMRHSKGDTSTHQEWIFVYEVEREADFERYQAEFAPALQRDHTERWGEHVERAWRERWSMEGVFRS